MAKQVAETIILEGLGTPEGIRHLPIRPSGPRRPVLLYHSKELGQPVAVVVIDQDRFIMRGLKRGVFEEMMTPMVQTLVGVQLFPASPLKIGEEIQRGERDLIISIELKNI
jgi:hypothetical protein